MPASTIPAYPGQPRNLGASGGGTALTTTKTHIAIPAGIRAVSLVPRNFSTAVAVKIALNPFLSILRTIDAMASSPTDYSEQAQDGDTNTVVTLNSQPTLANGGAVYVGAAEPFGGLNLTMVNTNSGGGTPGMYYWNGSAWTNTGATDGTTNLNASGDITWTVPTDWVPANLAMDILGYPRPGTGQNLYWIRWTTSVAYDASVSLSSIYSINRYGVSAGNEYTATDTLFEEINRAFNGGNIQALTNAGTANLIAVGYERRGLSYGA